MVYYYYMINIFHRKIQTQSTFSNSNISHIINVFHQKMQTQPTFSNSNNFLQYFSHKKVGGYVITLRFHTFHFIFLERRSIANCA